MSDLVGNPEDRFSHNKALMMFVYAFYSPMMSLHAEKSSVEDRLKRNRYNVLRTNADMDKGLSKR